MSALRLGQRAPERLRHMRARLAALLALMGSTLALLDLAEAGPQPAPPEVAPPRFVRAWGQKGTAPGEFRTPIGIAISAADHLFVADHNNRRVQRFDAQGKFLGAFEVAGKPGGIALDAQGRVYVSLWDPDRIAVYSESGKLLREWGRSGRGDGEFKFPAGLVVGPEGSVYLGDDVNRRVQKFSPEARITVHAPE